MAYPAFISGFAQPSFFKSKGHQKYSTPRCALEEPPVEISRPPVSVPPPRRTSNIGIAFEKVTDTIEDAYLHYSRLLRREKRKTTRPKVIILGTGWSSHAMIKVIETEAYDVTVVSPRNYFFFTRTLSFYSVMGLPLTLRYVLCTSY